MFIEWLLAGLFSVVHFSLLSLVTFVGAMWLGCSAAVEGLCSLDHRLQYHPSCDWIIISRMGDSNSLHRHKPFPGTNINLHRKWNCNFAKTRSRHTLEVICLEVSLQIKNICPLTLLPLQSNISCCHYSLCMMCWSNAWKRKAVHSGDLKRGWRTLLWFINFIQIPHSRTWEYNLHDCCSKSF